MGARYLFISILSYSFLFAANAETKPFHRVVVFSGGGFEFAQFLGAMEALEDSDKKPDLIIASCGGSIAAAIIANFSDPNLRRQFLFSHRFRDFVRSSQANKNILSVSAGRSWLNRRTKEAKLSLIPAIFTDYLIDAPVNLPLPEMNIAFSSSPIPMIIIGGKILFTSTQVGQPKKQKLFREVYFTSPDVGSHLKDFKSPVGRDFDSSSIDLNIEVNTDTGVMQAARAAATNPMIFPPALINHDYYVGGSINLYPLELARELAEEVVMSFGEDFSEYSGVPVIKAAFQFDANERLRSVTNQSANWWTDASDRSSALEEPYGFGIKNTFMSVYFRMPSEDNIFDRDIAAHFKYGKERMLEAIQKKTQNHKCHIRRLNQKNSSDFVRISCGAR